MPTRRLESTIKDLRKLPTTVTKEAGKVVKKIALEEAKRDTGGDGRMSGVGARGAKLRASARAKKRGRSVTVEVKGVPAGAWSMLHGGAKAHVIAPTLGVHDYMAGNLRHPIEKAVDHPGMVGRRTWSKVSERAHRECPEVAVELVRKAVH